MSTVQIEIDDEVLAKLDELAAERSLRRAEFIAMAIRKALWELEERQTGEAYVRQPDTDDAYVDAEAWEPAR